jgi:hypothetical protein
LRLLNARKPDPAITARNPATISHSTFAPVVASAAAGVVVDAGADGVTEFELADAADVPPALVAVVEKVYAVPLVKPVTVQEVAGAVMEHVAPPGAAVTV